MPAIKACSTHSVIRSLGTYSRAGAALCSHGRLASPLSAAFSSSQQSQQQLVRDGSSNRRGLNNDKAVVYYSSSSSSSSSSSTQRRAMSTAPLFSEGSDETALAEKLRTLLSSSSSSSSSASSADQQQQQGSGRWTLIANGQGLERSFKFKTFAKTWDFMTAVALQCKLKNHHPEWSNVYNTTFIRWTTHSPPGLSALDVELAAICDGLAKDFGEIVEDLNQGDKSCSLGRQLADTVASGAGDCCVPKPKANAKTQ
ncbi:hypothetical protein E8E14_008231 [Neopestalotiopsis sp. 37M]|nr:hypothetical protein E8E14_008231 [Neopestalotiopsis sp. 37M]